MFYFCFILFYVLIFVTTLIKFPLYYRYVFKTWHTLWSYVGTDIAKYFCNIRNPSFSGIGANIFGLKTPIFRVWTRHDIDIFVYSDFVLTKYRSNPISDVKFFFLSNISISVSICANLIVYICLSMFMSVSMSMSIFMYIPCLCFM